jgi:hypothetical protein
VLIVIRALRNVTYDSVNIHVTYLFSEDVALAKRRIDDAQKHLDGRGFPGAVRAKETKNLTLLYDEIEMIDDVYFPGARIIALR